MFDIISLLLSVISVALGVITLVSDCWQQDQQAENPFESAAVQTAYASPSRVDYYAIRF